MLATIFLVVIAALSADNRPEALVQAVISEAPHMTRDSAMPHVLEALAAETAEIQAELLLSVVYSESRYNSGATSYMIEGKRKAHVPRWAFSQRPPKGVSGPYFCGVAQVSAKMSWARCLQTRDLKTSYAKAVHEIDAWLKMCRKNKNRMRCALLGYGGGFPAIERKTSTYPSRVLNRARRILNKSIRARNPLSLEQA